MMSVIDNSGIGSIKKQIFLGLGLLFSCFNLGAMCPQTVGSISINEGIWNVLTRIGQATNVIESQLCALGTPSSGGGSDFTCTFTFGQADVGVGNIYTISAPGTYCMIENVAFSVGTAITVNSSDVTIDMQGHTLNGASGGGVGIRLGNFISNVIIQNGTIENINAFPGATAIRDTTIGLLPVPYLVNITIKNINFNNNDFGITVDVAETTGIYTDGLLIENCNFFGGINNDILVHSISTIVRGSLFQTAVRINEPIPVGGPVLGSPQIVVEDCVISSTSTSQIGSLNAQADNVVIRNCILQGPAYQGIQVAGSNVTISDCTVQDGDASNYLNGINLTNNTAPGNPGGAISALIERCFVANNGTGFYINFAGFAVKLVDCVADNNAFDGFNIIGGSTNNNNALAIICEQCSAQSNGLNGFVAQVGGSGENADFENVVFTDCQAARNGVCGFLVLNSEDGLFTSVAFDNCVAQVNSGDGFNLDNLSNGANSLNNISFNDCVSQGNTGGGSYTTPYALASATTYIGNGFGLNSSISAGRSVAVSTVAFTNCVAQNNANDGFDFGGTDTAAGSNLVDNISCHYCTAEQNGSHGMNFSLGAANCIVSQCLLIKNGGNGINNLNANAGPLSPNANSFLSNRSFNNVGVDYFQINDGVNGQPFFSRSTEASVQGASAWANMAS